LYKEFKIFIKKGNVLEMAVGLIMATYFGAIVKSLVNDIIMPPIGVFIGGIDFKSLKIVISQATETTPEVAIMYGNFINHIITFLIVSFSIFMVIKAYNKMKQKEEDKKAVGAPTSPSNEEVLLSEIRDILKDK
jgi:large conductance mechanosensitive channel